MIFYDTVTLYNVIGQSGRQPPQFRRTVIENVFWDSTDAASFGKQGKEDSGTVTVMIPFDIKAYMPYDEWEAAGFPEDRYTLSCGDIIVRGRHDGDTPDMFENDKFVITAVRDCRYGSRFISHWEVSGR